ncbi:endopeptidase La [Sarracenia purpurea var. burkii]
MLKALSSSCLRVRFHSTSSSLPSHLRRGTESNSPLLRVFGSLRGSDCPNPNFCRRLFFCSDSSDGPEPVEAAAESKRVEVEGEEAESKSSSAIVPTVFRPEDYLTVLALPLPHRPLFPGFYMPIYVKV